MINPSGFAITHAAMRSQAWCANYSIETVTLGYAASGKNTIGIFEQL